MDLISRQAAVEAVAEGLKGVFVEYRDIAEKLINKLPPAQPEDCSTCKHGHFGDRQCDYCGVRYPSHYERDEK